MSDENDPNNPLNSMFPQAGDNPRYEKLKREHEDKIQNNAEQGVLTDPTFSSMSDRMQRLRKNNPIPPNPQPMDNRQAAAPEQQQEEAREAAGIRVDPEQGRVKYDPVTPRLPAEEAPTVEPSQQQPVTTQRRIMTNSPGVNPVLAKLRQDFGIDSIPTVDVVLGDSKFTLRLLDSGSVAMAVRFADSLSLAERENVLKLQLACVSFAVQSIDGVPLWKVFDIPIPEDEKVTVEGRETHRFDGMHPPAQMKIQAAATFMEFLSEEAAPSLSDELWTAYGKKVDPQGSLSNILERLAGDEKEEVEDFPLP